MRLPGKEFMGIIDDNGRWVKENYGMHNLIGMWAHWSEHILEPTLGPMIEKDGFKGMADFWKPSLSAEGADSIIHYDNHQFILEIKNCPHMKFAKEHKRPIPDDFDHCMKCYVLYYFIMRKYGYNWENIVHDQSGQCIFKATRQTRSAIPKIDKKLTADK